MESHVLEPEVVALLRKRRAKCYLCRYILADFEKHKRLTNKPETKDHRSAFPAEEKLRHVRKEMRTAMRVAKLGV